jgi:hypothetical protein
VSCASVPDDDEAHRVPLDSLQPSLSSDDLEFLRVSERTRLLADIYREGRSDDLPPVLVCGAHVGDGHHRYLAAIAAGKTHIWATRSFVRAFGPAVYQEPPAG